MPIPTFSVDERAIELAKFDNQLAFAMDSCKVDGDLQAHIAKTGIFSLSRFANLTDDVAEFKKILKDELGLDPAAGMAMRLSISDVVDAWTCAKAMVNKRAEIVADARVNETPLIVQKGDYRAMQKAYENKYGKIPKSEIPGRYFLGTKIEEVVENEPRVELLIEVACRQDHESDIWTPVFGEDGRVKTRKGSLVRVPPPKDGEELRTRHRLIGNAWIMAHLNHTNRPWLANVTPKTWSDFTDFIVGDTVNKYQADLPGGRKSPLPAWDTVLHYEYQLRLAAYELVASGTPLEAALKEVIKCGNIRQMHFTTPCQFSLGLAKGNAWKPREPESAVEKIKNVFLKPTKGGDTKGDKGNPKGKGKGKGKKGSSEKNKRKFCYAYNNGNDCNGSCGFVHACQYCGETHPKVACEKLKNKKGE